MSLIHHQPLSKINVRRGRGCRALFHSPSIRFFFPLPCSQQMPWKIFVSSLRNSPAGGHTMSSLRSDFWGFVELHQHQDTGCSGKGFMTSKESILSRSKPAQASILSGTRPLTEHKSVGGQGRPAGHTQTQATLGPTTSRLSRHPPLGDVLGRL
uniref:Uncharacterized protein n=1 Tax=Mus musculus TaxID=10090 RepID=Q3UM36_MOUSE|nr:unnamed protein product [Mus musculus]BAE26262.1 unnamed protein product [Mus musculus]